jgi:integrase
MRFTGKVSFVERKGSTFARATYLQNGKRREVWRKVEGKRRDAQNAVINEIESILSNTDSTPRTFHELAEYVIKTKAIPANFVNDEKVKGIKTYKQMRSVIGDLDTFYDDTPLTKMTRDAVQRYRVHIIEKPARGKQRSNASVFQHLRILRSVLNVAEQERWMDRAPSFKGLISSAAEARREDIPSRETFDRILDATQERQRLNHIKPVVLMIADCGARPVELWYLKWSKVDFETMEVTLMSDKGVRRHYRTVPITTRVAEALQKLPRLNEYVFGGIKSVKRGWNSIRLLAKTEVDLYSLRHVFATRLDMMPISQNQRQKLMGHSSKEMFGRYAKLTQETSDAVRQYLEDDPYLPITGRRVKSAKKL